MDRVSAARVGMRGKQIREAVDSAQKRIQETKSLLESNAWVSVKARLREKYIEMLKECPVGDDLQRYRLVESLKVLDYVEKHVKMAHNDAVSDLERQMSRDMGGGKLRFVRR